jgi:RNA polymerase sigma-B factor
MGARLGEEDPSMEDVENRATLSPLLAQLAPRERLILQLRFFEGLTQSEIAGRLGISQMHVSRLLARSVGQLRSSADAPAL